MQATSHKKAPAAVGKVAKSIVLAFGIAAAAASLVCPASGDEAQDMGDRYDTGDSSFAFESYKLEPLGRETSDCGEPATDTVDLKGPYRYSCRRTILARDLYDQIHKFSAIACRHGKFPIQARFNANADAGFMLDHEQKVTREAAGIKEQFFYTNVRTTTRCKELPKDDEKIAKQPFDETGDNEMPESEAPPPPGPPASHPDTVKVTVINHDRYWASVKLYSQSRNWNQFPNPTQHRVLKSPQQTMELACEAGENICVGAWRDHQDVEWGVGRHNMKGCTNCCVICGGDIDFVLDDRGSDKGPPPAVFVLHNRDREDLGLQFYSVSSTWPNSAQQYALPSGSNKTARLTCTTGESICFGAWRQSQSRTWGMGHKDHDCGSSCCISCGGKLETTLNDGGEEPPPQISNNDSGSDNGANTRAAIDILGAVLTGYARSRGGGGGGVVIQRSRPSGGGFTPGPPVSNSQSGISGPSH